MPRSPHRSPPSRLYRSIALGFSFLVLVLAATTLVLALSRAVITITPSRVQADMKTAVTVTAAPDASPDAIAGNISIETLTLDASSPAIEGKLVEDHAHGVMSVVNNYNRSQTLVSTTRFLSKDGVLFRTTEGIIVPAGGKAEVNVRADRPGKGGEIAPGHFIIPGLWTGIQDKIYGETSSPMTGGERRIAVISAHDLEKARAALAALQTAKLHELNAKNENTPSVRALEKVSEKILTPAGREADAARIQGTYALTEVDYDAKALADRIAQQTAARYGDAGRTTISPPTITLERADRTSATLMAAYAVHTAAREDDLALDPRLLKGKKTADAERLLLNLPGVGGAHIKLTPAFLKRLPRLPDHIKIVVQED